MKCYTFFFLCGKIKIRCRSTAAGRSTGPLAFPRSHCQRDDGNSLHPYRGTTWQKKNHLTLERILLCMQRAYKHAIITPSFEKRYAPSHNLQELKVHNAHTINILLCILANIVCIITKYYVLSKLPSRVSCLLTVLFLHSTFLSIF